MFIGHKNSMLQPSADNKHIHSWASRENEHSTFFFNLNCKSEYVIYLMECILCKMQYVWKAETAFNLRLNNHRKDTKKPNSILACKHFQEKEHNFNKHAKFIIIDKLVNLHGSKEALRELLVIESFCIQKLKALVPFGLNQELSK